MFMTIQEFVLVLKHRGMYGIRIKALLGRTAIDAPTINVR